MVNKLVLQSVINKYYLGENESVKWVIKDNILNINFNSPNKEVIGKIVCNSFKLEDCNLIIFNTKKLSNLLKITAGDLLLELEKTNNICTKLFISDPDFKLSYALADPLVLGKVGTVNEPDWEVVLNLTKEDVANLVKAKSALADIDNMIITTELDFNGDMVCKFTFGDEKGHNNKITYEIDGKIDNTKIKLPFNSEMFKNILQVNKDTGGGILCLNSKGLMKLKFVSDDISCEYFLVRKDNSSF